MDRWLVTGAAGFVGAHVCRRLLLDGHAVVGVDSLNDYYDPAVKHARLERLLAPAAGRVVYGLDPVGIGVEAAADASRPSPTRSNGGEPPRSAAAGQFTFERLDVADRVGMLALFERVRPTVVVHLAAQAGVRHSLSAPHAYIETNLLGFGNILEACSALSATERGALEHLVYASSSSVYGGNARLPFDARDPRAASHPISLYAATKRANELMAHAYSHLHGIPTTGLRFFTVYGPYGRPDMAYWRFAEAIYEGREIVIYGDGGAVRDFTYVDDVVEALVRVASSPPVGDVTFDAARPDPATSDAPWRVCNIGYGAQATLEELIDLLEEALERPARRRYAERTPGDVPATRADTRDLTDLTGYTPRVGLREGIVRFASWYGGWRASRLEHAGAGGSA